MDDIKADANSVRDFLSRFHSSANVDEVFTNGCCYWFALILFVRFIESGAKIVYDPTVGHFATKIRGRVYDVTGDVTYGHKWEPWSSFQDPQRSRITRDCIMF